MRLGKKNKTVILDDNGQLIAQCHSTQSKTAEENAKTLIGVSQVYAVKASSGSWDDYNWWLEGLFSTPEEAESHKQLVISLIEKCKQEKSPLDCIKSWIDEIPGWVGDEDFDKINKWQTRQLQINDFNGCEIIEIKLGVASSESLLNNKLLTEAIASL